MLNKKFLKYLAGPLISLLNPLVSYSEDLPNNLDFSLKIFSQLKSEAENFAASPFSIEQVLKMVLVGAKGETANEISALFSNKTNVNFLEYFKELEDKGQFKLRIANGIWIDTRYPFLSSYTDQIEKEFGAKLKNEDFLEDSKSIRKRINKWISKFTENTIMDFLPENAVTPATKFILANAIYFKADWDHPFKKEATKTKDFWINSNEKVSTEFMNHYLNSSYAEDEEFKLLELNYEGKSTSMVFLLPKKKNDLSNLEKTLTNVNIEKLFNSIKSYDVSISIPKFKYSFGKSLIHLLKALGVTKAFIQSEADFSGISDTNLLYISEVLHKTFITTDEKGTEAAAATAVVGFSGSNSDPTEAKSFVADHPFVFLIREKRYGNILFIGRVSNPTKE